MTYAKANMKEFQQAAAFSGAMRVLVVDDSRAMRKVVVTHLKRWGFTTMEASDGAEALEICKDASIDVILSDWEMPKMDGLEFCRQFRALDRDRYGYFILLTSRNEKNDVAMGLEIGADDFLSKPVNSTELKARIRSGMRVLDMEHQLREKHETVQNALVDLQAAHDSISRDLVEAEKFQQSLVPVRHKSFDAGDVSILFKSCSHVGGDLVGFFSFAPDRLGLFSIDVSGHGISSALLTARLAGWMSPISQEQNVTLKVDENGKFYQRDPAKVASVLNDRMCSELETDHYFTLCYADVDLSTGRVRMVQAGHPHPVLFNEDKRTKFIGNGGPPIGLMPEMEFETNTFHLEPGDRLLLYSDGLTECEAECCMLLDESGLQRIVDRNKTISGRPFMDNMWNALTDFAEHRPISDDVSAILLEFNSFAK